MSMIFTVPDDTDMSRQTATITTCQLSAFRTIAALHEERFGITIIDPVGRGFASRAFDARVCPLALATIATAFDYDLALITLVEEAQFHRRLIRFECDPTDATLRARVSERADIAFEMENMAGDINSARQCYHDWHRPRR